MWKGGLGKEKEERHDFLTILYWLFSSLLEPSSVLSTQGMKKGRMEGGRKRGREGGEGREGQKNNNNISPFYTGYLHCFQILGLFCLRHFKLLER